jgi:4-alpha-glucanotransferase
MSTPEDTAIETLAGSVGVAPRYRDAQGRDQHVSIATKRAVLLSMGFDLSSINAIRAALQARVDAEWHCLLAPVTVLRRSPDAISSVTVTLPEVLLSRPLDWRLELEGGTTLSGTSMPESLAHIERRSEDGSAFVRLLLPLPRDLDDGYHKLTVTTGHTEAAMTVVGTPPTAYVPDWVDRGERRWGLACPLFALWSDASWGIGDFSDLAALARIARELGASVIGLNPLHAPMPGELSDPNPYLPSSRIFLNPAYIDVTRIPPPVDRHDGWGFDRDPRFAARLARARGADLVDYPLVHRLKHEALEEVHRSRHWDGPTVDPLGSTGRPRAGLQAFRREHGAALVQFALFNALQEQFGTLARHEWPMEVRTPRSAGIAAFVKERAERIDHHIWLQWVADQQLAAAAELETDKSGTGLYRDLAVGISRDGADAWADPDTYLTGASVGPPPDAFNPAGQDWGMPPPSPLALRANGYAAFIAAVRANMRHAQVLRIDHVMGLQRLYWVPSGLPATSGAYVRYPLDDMLGILALESRRNRCLIVGEDLGTLPAGFRERMAGTKLLSYRLLMFERYPDGLFRRPSTYPPMAVASFGTHDLPTIWGWWEGRDIELRRALGLYSADEAEQDEKRRQDERVLLLAALRDQDLAVADLVAMKDLDLSAMTELVVAIEQFLARSPSALMMANLSDMLAETTQINVPGTVSEHPNWRCRFRLPVSALPTCPLVRRTARVVATERGTAAAPPQ